MYKMEWRMQWVEEKTGESKTDGVLDDATGVRKAGRRVWWEQQWEREMVLVMV